MVTLRDTRFSKGLLSGEQIGKQRPIAPLIFGDRLPKTKHRCAMAQHVRHRCLLFSTTTVFGPVIGDWALNVELLLLDQARCARRHQTLGDRKNIDQRIGLPRPRFCRVTITAKKVDNPLTSVLDRQ